jgi:Bacterial Ig domain
LTQYGFIVLWRWSYSMGYEALANCNGGSLSIDPAGNVYGITPATSDYPGTLWRWNGVQGLVEIADFNLLMDGSPGETLVFGDQGQIYGTSNLGQLGAIWKWTAETGLTQLLVTYNQATFAFAGNQVRGANGEWYGIRYPECLLFSWTEAGGIQYHFVFGSSTPANLRTALARDAAGNFYGTMGNSPSQLWKWNAASGLAILANFDADTTGEEPRSLVAAADGQIRGVCATGGAYGQGTIWNWSGSRGLCAIHHFHPQNAGLFSQVNLVQEPDGNLVGVANGLLWRYAFGTPQSRPSVTTGAVIQNYPSKTIISGAANANGLSTLVSLSWGAHPDALNWTVPALPTSINGTEPGSFTATISGLRQHTMIFARFTASNEQGSDTGDLVTFITPNHPPIAFDDVIHSPSIASGTFTVDVLDNDVDENGALELASIEQGENGVATIVDNKIKYTPNPGYVGKDTITYYVRDADGETDSAQLTLINSPLTAVDDLIQLEPGGRAVFNPLTNDSDGDGDPLVIIAVTPPEHGTVTFSAASITYVRDAQSFGGDHFTYRVTDNRGVTATANVELRPGGLLFHRLLSVGAVIPTTSGDALIKGFGSSGLSDGNFLLLKTETNGKQGQTLVTFQRVMLQTGDPVPDLPGTIIKSIEEPAGCAVSVKYLEEGRPDKLRRAVLYLNVETPVRLVRHEGEVLPDGSVLTAINRFSGVNGRVFVLGKMRPSYGGTAQTLRVWQDGQEEELLRTGGSVRSITTLLPTPRSPADNRWVDEDGHIVTRLVLDETGEAIVVLHAGQLSRTVASRGGKTDVNSNRFISFGLPALCLGSAAFRSVVLMNEIGRGPVRTQFLFGMKPGFGLDSIGVQHGLATSPSLNGLPESTFVRFFDPVVGNAGQYAYLADIKTPVREARFLFLHRNGWRKPIAFEGGSYGANERLGRIKSVVYPRSTNWGPVFTTTARHGVILWATNESGAATPLAKPGSVYHLQDGDRTVASIRALEGAVGPGLARRGFTDDGSVDAIIKFTDGSESLSRFLLP